jgi:hypothetical protein
MVTQKLLTNWIQLAETCESYIQRMPTTDDPQRYRIIHWSRTVRGQMTKELRDLQKANRRVLNRNANKTRTAKTKITDAQMLLQIEREEQHNQGDKNQ